MPLTFFDANVAVGLPRNAGLFSPVETPDQLAAYLGDARLSGALIWHWAQKESHVASGNGLLQPYLEAADQVYPCWAVLPPVTAEPTGLSGDVLDALPAALRLFPQEHRYLVRRPVWGDFLDAVSQRRVPVLLSLEHGASWDQAYDLLADFPDLTCVLCDVGVWSMDRYTYPLLDTYPNVALETGMLSITDGGVEGVVRRFGADRLVFGTGFPRRYAEAAVLQLTHADIDAADRQAIAADNMLRLLEEGAR
jgi:hypothetical protein